MSRCALSTASNSSRASWASSPERSALTPWEPAGAPAASSRTAARASAESSQRRRAVRSGVSVPAIRSEYRRAPVPNLVAGDRRDLPDRGPAAAPERLLRLLRECCWRSAPRRPSTCCRVRSTGGATASTGSVCTITSPSVGQRSRTASSIAPAWRCADGSGCSPGSVIVTSAMRPPSPSRNETAAGSAPVTRRTVSYDRLRARRRCRRAAAGAPSRCQPAARCGCARCAARGSQRGSGPRGARPRRAPR